MPVIRRLLPLLLITCGLATCTTPGDRRFTTRASDRASLVAMRVDPANLRADIDGLLAARRNEPGIPSRWSAEMPLTHFESAAYMARRFQEVGVPAVIDHTTDDALEVLNVSGDVRGTLHPDEIVLLMGHHDAWYSGADDNASALAVLIEAARVIKDMPGQRTIRFLALDREEEGSIGALRYLRDHSADNVVAFVNLDCVAYASNSPGSQMSPPGLSIRDIGNFAAVIANEPAELALSRAMALAPGLPHPIDAVGLMTPDDGYYPATLDLLRSDHAPFWRRGIPGLFITDTASFRNPHYHTPSDTPETLDYEFFRRTAEYIIAIVAAMSTSE